MVRGLGEHNWNAGRNEDARFAVQGVDIEPAWFPLREEAVDLELEISDVFLLAQSDLVRSVNEFLSQSTSPSVGGAPVGAGGGTPESTEGGQPRSVGEKKSPQQVQLLRATKPNQ